MFWKCVLCGDQAVLILSHTVKLSAGKGKLKTTPQYAQDFNMKNSSCFFLLWLPSWQIFCSEGLPPGLMPTKVRTVGFSMWLSEEIPLSTDKKSRFYLFFFSITKKWWQSQVLTLRCTEVTLLEKSTLLTADGEQSPSTSALLGLLSEVSFPLVETHPQYVPQKSSPICTVGQWDGTAC